ncbi:Uncharacterised protein g844 [Pycnogonum litorale]
MPSFARFYRRRFFRRLRWILLVTATSVIFLFHRFLFGKPLIPFTNRMSTTFRGFLEDSTRPRLDHDRLALLTDPHHVCRPSSDPLDVVFVVHSSVYNFENRAVIRKTLGEFAPSSYVLRYSLLFVVGTPSDSEHHTISKLLKESSNHDDVLIVDVEDTRRHVTYKTMSWIKWASEKCLKNRFVFKIDDDVLVNVHLLADFVWSCYSQNDLNACNRISCDVHHNVPVTRFIGSDRSIRYVDYPLDTYRSMCPGQALIIPTAMLNRLVIASAYVPFVPLDDVYVTSILLGYLDEEINPINDLYIDRPDETAVESKMVVHVTTDDFKRDFTRLWRLVAGETV